ncbi:MAG: hypothetical protein DLM53_01090 [Candidatus Eremiobacter antarcticus]|nr:MAG: hypothetical protein DLM53_01090 [Candidatus Eremiobacter sp. RRmetagenome_bin22]
MFACTRVAATAQDTGLTPGELFGRVRSAVSELPVPDFIVFTVQNQSVGTDGSFQERLRLAARTGDGASLVRELDDSTGSPVKAAPEIVRDNVFIRFTTIYRVNDFPVEDFGLRYAPSKRPGIFEAMGTPQPPPAQSKLKEIGAVRAFDNPYRIVDLGDTTARDQAVYHLGLTPLRDPGHHVLREMWVDKKTSLPVRYIAERFVDRGLLAFHYFVTVNTALIDRHLVNVDADGHFNVVRFPVHFSGEGKWSISEVSFPAQLPDWMFDPATFPQHRYELIPV